MAAEQYTLVAKMLLPTLLAAETAGGLGAGVLGGPPCKGWLLIFAPHPSHQPPPSSTHLRIRAFMSRSHEVRALSCPPSWSAWPLLVAGTRTRMSVPVIMPTMGDT